jgi:hypothetical protein
MPETSYAATVRRVLHVTVAAKITSAMLLRVPSFLHRVALSVGSVVLVAALASLPALSALPAATIPADLALAVTASTLLQGVMASGPASLPLSLAHCCILLHIGQVVPLGAFGAAFLGNIQFLFAQSVGQLLVETLAPPLACISACALAALSAWRADTDALLSVALTQAAIFVLRTMLMDATPALLRLPTITALLCFSSPLYDSLTFAEPLHTFALYQAGDTLKDTLQAACSHLVATAAALALAFVAPAPVFAAVAQIAAVSCATDLAMLAIAPAATVDPVLCLLPLLVFTAVLTRFVTPPTKT